MAKTFWMLFKIMILTIYIKVKTTGSVLESHHFYFYI